MITLTKDQQAIKDDVLSFINAPTVSDKFYVICGPAGCGKTTLVTSIIKSIPRHKNIGFTAPTHKATKVAGRMTRESNIDHIGTRTIHSALAVSMKRVHGEEILVREKFAKEKVYDILFIDESGMLGFDIIRFITECKSSRIIFVGDKYQVGPVQSATFDEKGNDIYMPPAAYSPVFDLPNCGELTEVIRTAKDNPILQLATQFRYVQDDVSLGFPQIMTNLTPEGHGINVIRDNDWFNCFLNKIKSDEFKKDQHHCRAVCYTNDEVDSINVRVRKALHGDDVDEYVVGEILIAQSGGKEKESYANSEELEVISISEGDSSTVDDYGVESWQLTLKSLETFRYYTVVVVKNRDKERFDNRLKRLADKALASGKDSKRYWKDFWAMKDAFSEFKYCYAMTTHKCQGSTFDYTYIATPDFVRFGPTMEVKRLLYTAITRSRYRTTFLY